MNKNKVLEALASLNQKRLLSDYLSDVETKNDFEFNTCLREAQNLRFDITTTEVQTLLRSFLKYCACTKVQVGQDTNGGGSVLNIGEWIKVFLYRKRARELCEVYFGYFQKHQVEVKHVKDLTYGYREIENFMKFAQHPFVAQLIGYDYVDDIMSEHAGYYICSDFGERLCHKPLTQTIANSIPSASTMENLRQMIRGLAYIHSKNCFLGNLSSASITYINIEGREVAKITNFDRCGKDISDLSWPTPEYLKGDPQTQQSDIFNLACVFYFVLTGGKHPFASKDGEYINATKVYKGNPDLSHFKDVPDVKDLLSKMLRRNPEWRPKTNELCHPFFWESETRLDFLCCISDKITDNWRGDQFEDHDARYIAVSNLQVNGGRRYWTSYVDKSYLDLMKENRNGYDGKHITHLLRLIRNTKHHMGNFIRLFGDVSLDNYFRERFPFVLIDVYMALRPLCYRDDWFIDFERRNLLRNP